MYLLHRSLTIGVLAACYCGSTAAQRPEIETKASLQPDGHVEFLITNNTSRKADAYVILIETHPIAKGTVHSQTVRYVDIAVNPHEQALLPGATRRFRFAGPQPGPTRVRTDVTFGAAIFADGTSFGEATWVDKLLEIRKRMCLRATWALRLLAEKEGDPRLTIEELVDHIKKAAVEESLKAENVEDRMAIDAFQREVTANLSLAQETEEETGNVRERIRFTMKRLAGRRQRIMAALPRIPGLQPH